MKERIEWLDYLSGLLIVWKIVYHAFIYTGNKHILICEELYRAFYFFMPWFFFKSGMFAVEKTIKVCVIFSAKKLLVPYVIFSILGVCSQWIHYTPVLRSFCCVALCEHEICVQESYPRSGDFLVESYCRCFSRCAGGYGIANYVISILDRKICGFMCDGDSSIYLSREIKGYSGNC